MSDPTSCRPARRPDRRRRAGRPDDGGPPARARLRAALIDKAPHPSDEVEGPGPLAAVAGDARRPRDRRPTSSPPAGLSTPAGSTATASSCRDHRRRRRRGHGLSQAAHDLPQSETERLLTEHLREVGVAVERPVELVRFAERGDGVDATLRHADGREEEVRCDWLLGCDGAHSTVRHALGLEFTGEAEPNDWILADCRIDGLPDEVSIFWHAKGVLAFFPFGEGRCRIIADLGTGRATASRADPTLAEVQAIVDDRGPGGVTALRRRSGSRASASTNARSPTTARAGASSRATRPTSTAPPAARG